jgi:hypothetical protein
MQTTQQEQKSKTQTRTKQHHPQTKQLFLLDFEGAEALIDDRPDHVVVLHCVGAEPREPGLRIRAQTAITTTARSACEETQEKKRNK